MPPRSVDELLGEVAGLSERDLTFRVAYNDMMRTLIAEAYERGRYDMGHGWNARVVPDEPLMSLPPMPPRSPRTETYLG